MAKSLKTTTPIDISWSITGDFLTRFTKRKHDLYSFKFSDDKVVQIAEAKWWFYNLIFWKPLILRNLPIERRHFFHDEYLTTDSIRRITNEIYEDVVKITPSYPDIVQILREILEITNTLNNVANMYLGDYVQGISYVEIEELLHRATVKKTTHIDVEDTMLLGIHAVERKLESVYSKTMKLLSSKEMSKGNVLYPYLALGIINQQQLAQVTVAAGTRTDVNDMTLHMAITDPYIFGMSGIRFLMIDSLSAKKSAYYNTKNLKDSQYMNRKMQLLCSSLFKIHPGDCGTTVTKPYHILESTYKYCVGKNFIEDGQLKTLTYANIKEYVGKIVNFRSPETCRHSDGSCIVCGGKVLENCPPQSVPGIISAQETMSPISQLYLSNKHFSKSSSVPYRADPLLLQLAEVIRNEIHFNSSVDLKQIKFVFPHHAVNKLSDLKYVKNSVGINDQYFSEINEMMVIQSNTGEIVFPCIPMKDDNGTTPYLSSEVLKYIIDNPDALEVRAADETNKLQMDYVFLDLSKFDATKPFMRYVVQNDSMPAFVRRVQALFTSEFSKRYTSIPEAFKDFSNLVYSKVGVNIVHLEMVMKAFLITSNIDYRIPVVTDIENVKFGTVDTIIQGRSIGTMLIFQNHVNYFTSPESFIIPKEAGVFDKLVGFIA